MRRAHAARATQLHHAARRGTARDARVLLSGHGRAPRVLGARCGARALLRRRRSVCASGVRGLGVPSRRGVAHCAALTRVCAAAVTARTPLRRRALPPSRRAADAALARPVADTVAVRRARAAEKIAVERAHCAG
jgi:hypothetical protein